MSVDLKGIIDWLNGWFYRKEEVNTYLNAKANKNLTNANMNVVTDSSGNITTEAKPTIPDVSGKIDTAGTGLSKSGTTLNHSNSITAQSSTVFKKIKYDGQGHITGTANVESSDLPSHNHSISNITDLQTNLDNKVDKVTGKGLSTNDYTTAEKNKLANIEAEANKTVVDSVLSSTSTNPVQNKAISSKVSEIETTLSDLETIDIVESSALSNIGTNANATQHTINTAINTKIGDLSSIKAIEVVSTLPTASSSTMGRLYIISENSKINVYYTEQNGSSYSWHKMDSDILDELSIDWSDVQNKPSTFTPSSHTHSISNITNLQTSLDGKAPTDHSSTATTYGVGTSTKYGHNKVINNLTTSSYVDGNSLSAYQGYVLKRLIDGLDEDLTDVQDFVNDLNASSIPFSPSATDWGEGIQVATNVENALTLLKQIQNTKQDSGDCITSIELVPKTDDSTGAIRLYYGDEPSNNS